jgi:PGF-CTERM protein
MINPLVNDVDLTVQSILKVSSGVHITATSFAASGSNQFTGTFKVRPGEENHITIQVTAAEVGPKIIESQIIYYPGEDKSKFSQLQQTMTINAIEISDPLIPTPVTITTPARSEAPVEAPAPTGKVLRVPGFEAIFAIAGLLAVAYLVGRKE